MKFTCNRDAFSKLFFLAATVVSSRDVKAILQNVKVVAGDDKLVLTATDIELSVRLELSEFVQIQEPGEAILPTKLFRNILQVSADNELTIESNSEQTLVYGERSRYQLPTQLASEFPEILPFEATAFHTVSASSLKQLIRRTVFATDTESARYTLGGVLMEFTDEQIAAVATDGRRLAHQQASATATNGHRSENESIFQVKTLSLIEKSINETDDVKISITDSKRVSIQTGNVVVHSNLIEGRFPRWRGIVPSEEGKLKVDIIVGQLLSGVRQAGVVTQDKEPGINFLFSQGKLEIKASGAEVGESQIEIPISFEAEPVQIRMDARFVVDFLRELDPEMIVSLYFTASSPVLFKTDDGYSYVVMPLNI